MQSGTANTKYYQLTASDRKETKIKNRKFDIIFLTIMLISQRRTRFEKLRKFYNHYIFEILAKLNIFAAFGM
jgi:hypothetical protein